MYNKEVEKAKPLIVVEIIEYVPNSVVHKSIEKAAFLLELVILSE